MSEAFFRQAIQRLLDGDYPHPPTYRHVEGAKGQCPHGKYWFEECGNCTDEYLQKVLDTSESDLENMVVLDKRDLFDFVRAEITDALETEWVEQPKAHTFEEATNRTLRCLRKIVSSPQPSPNAAANE